MCSRKEEKEASDEVHPSSSLSRTEPTIEQTRPSCSTLASIASKVNATARAIATLTRKKITNDDGKMSILDKTRVAKGGKKTRESARERERESMKTNCTRGWYHKDVMLALNDFAIASTRSLILSSSPPARTLFPYFCMNLSGCHRMMSSR